jgi:uncharacterized coiled-coil protein SlyX
VGARRQEADAMVTPKLLNRLEMLEVKLSALEALPARIDALAVQIGEQREVLERAVSALRGEIVSCREDLRQEIAGVREELRQQIADTRTHMLILHEEVLERIKLLGEGMPSRKGPPRRRH